MRSARSFLQALTFVPALALIPGLAGGVLAQSAGAPMTAPAFCDPFLTIDKDKPQRDGDEDAPTASTRRLDRETAEVLTSEQAIMDALYEEKWDLGTGEPIARNAICEAEPSYVINWAELSGKGADGKDEILAKGLFQFRKDGSFEFVYNKRPYAGQWAVTDMQMVLTADWLNGGDPVAAPVERVATPVETTGSNGKVDSYTEQSYRIGAFRLFPIDTTVPGRIQDCACPVN